MTLPAGLLAVALALVAPLAAAQAPPRAVPMPIERHSGQWSTECRNAGGRPTLQRGFRTDADLNGDGVADVILDLEKLNCAGMGSLFCGSAGCPIEVLIAEGGLFRSIWQQHTRGWSLDRSRAPPALTLELHGSACGLAGVEECRKRYGWDNGTFAELRSGRTGRPPAAAPAPPAVAERWTLGRAANGEPMAMAPGPGVVEGIGLFCVDGLPHVIFLLRATASVGTSARVVLAIDRGTPEALTLAARGPPIAGGRPVLGGELRLSPVPRLLAAGGQRLQIVLDGRVEGVIALDGAAAAVRSALSRCYRFG